MTPHQLNRARALRQTGFKVTEIARLMDLPVSEVHKATTKPNTGTVEDTAKKLLAKQPTWFTGTPAEWRHQVVMVFGEVTA